MSEAKTMTQSYNHTITQMKILIVEDENLAAERLKDLIFKYDSSIELLDWLDSVEETVEWLKANDTPDLLFFDIQLADGLSFEIFDAVEVKTPVIFTTAFDEYALRAFKVNSIDYLLKPIDYPELVKAIDKFKGQFKQTQPTIPDWSILQETLKVIRSGKDYKTRFAVKKGHHLASIPVANIAYFYSEHRISWLKTKDGKKYAVDYTLDQLSELLKPNDFFRLNRKYITSIEAIKDVVTYSNSRLKVQLSDTSKDDLILVSRDRVSDFKDWLDG
ncbi:MAG: LytR/AlgR family response regulator transcription factor [Saprospiraceae bacterium]